MNVPADALGEWAPFTLDEVAAQLRGAPFRWWVAGGWAIDLFVGRQTREHKDVEITVLCHDEAALQQWFVTWDLWYVAVPGGLKRWEPGVRLEPAVHEIWARRPDERRWQMEVLLENSTPSGDWSYRRDGRITLPIERFGTEIKGLPIVRAEIALLYKSKDPRPHDQADFEVISPLLDEGSRRWLADALAMCGTGGEWLPRLSSGNT